MGTNPSAYAITGVLAKRLNGQNFRGFDFAELPVENVDWFDCRRFASDLNALGVAPDGFEFRLPTFAEGEIATRAGTSTAFYWGDEPDLSQANLQPPPEPNGAYRAGTPKPVRSYPPNPWGLYDTVGNAVMADGSVRFVSETIDCGDLSIPAPLNPTGVTNLRPVGGKSPYGVWGALGTINCGETNVNM